MFCMLLTLRDGSMSKSKLCVVIFITGLIQQVTKDGHPIIFHDTHIIAEDMVFFSILLIVG
jgi:hypothetical protein